MTPPEQMILRSQDVVTMVGLSRVTIWRRVKDGDFPQPLRLGGPKSRAVGWRRSDVERWLDDLTPQGSNTMGSNDGRH